MTEHLARRVAIVAILSCASLPAAAQTVPPKYSETISFEVGGSYTTGEVREYAYDPDTRRRLSYLNWRLDGVYGVTAGMAFRVIPTIAIRASGWVPLEKDKGKLKDYDYLNPNGFDWTDLSQSDTKLREAYKADANVAVSFYGDDVLDVYAIGGYRQQSFHFDGVGGNYTYTGDAAGCAGIGGTFVQTTTGTRNCTGSFPGGEKVISYLQTTKTPYAGLGATADLGPVRVTGEVVGSMFTKTDSKDTHYLRSDAGLVFYQKEHNGKFVGATLKGEYAITPNVSVIGAVTYDEYFDSKGKTKVLDVATGATGVTAGGSVGGGSSLLGVSVGVKARM